MVTGALYMTSWHFHIYSLCHTLVALSTMQSDACSSKTNHCTVTITVSSTRLLVLLFEITLEFPEFCPSIIFGMILHGSDSIVLPLWVIFCELAASLLLVFWLARIHGTAGWLFCSHKHIVVGAAG